MDELVAFLQARLDEDEADADRVHDIECDVHRGFADERGDCNCIEPTRVLADVDLKRKIIEMYGGAVAALARVDGDLDAEAILRATLATCETAMRLLGLSYADHPNYREQWRPSDPA